MRSLLAAVLLTACAGEAGPEIPPPDPTIANDPTTAEGSTESGDAPSKGAQTEPGEIAPQAASCAPLDVCDAPALDFKPRGFVHSTSKLVAKLGAPHHRVRDMLFAVGEKQRLHAKLAYGANDKDIHGEPVELFVQRACGQPFERLGEATTTEDGEHATVDGVDDNGGRVYFDVPAGKELGPGRHRVRAVVAGDGTFADGFVDVVPKGTPIVVSDVDGTLTSSELVEAVDFVTNTIPETHEGAPEAMQALAKKGYRMLYLTARPELLTERTRAFIAKRGFPPGLVRTSSSSTGQLGSGATSYKRTELELIAAQGLVTSFGFGNKTSDSDAYETTIADEQRRIFYRIDGHFSGRRIESYTELLKDFEGLDAVCK